MQVPKRVSISEILLALKALFVASNVLPENRIFIIARNTGIVPQMQAPQDMLLRPRGFTVDQGMVAAGGRYTTRLTRIIDVIIRVRYELDKVGEDVLWLTTASLGYFAFEEAAVNAMQVQIDGKNNTLLDSAGNSLLAEPMRIVDGMTPEKDITGKTPGWGNGAFGISVAYLANVDVAIQ